MRIVIDLDGTICSLKKQDQSYKEVTLLPGAKKRLNQLKQEGHYIIIQTARHMKTTGGDQGLAMARIGKVTLDWLKKNKVPYDEIYFGKPYGDVYIDDLAQSFTGWDHLDSQFLDDERILYYFVGENQLDKKLISKLKINPNEITFLQEQDDGWKNNFRHYGQVIISNSVDLLKFPLSAVTTAEGYDGCIIVPKKMRNAVGKVDANGYLLKAKLDLVKGNHHSQAFSFYYKKGLDVFNAINHIPKPQPNSSTLLQAFYRLVSVGKRIKVLVYIE